MFMLALVVGIGASTGYAIYRLRAEAIAGHARMAGMQARSIEDHLTQSFNIVNQTLANALSADAERLTTPEVARRFETALMTSPAMRSVSLLDGRHRIVVSSHPRNVGVVVDDRDFIPPQVPGSAAVRIGRRQSGRDFADGPPIGTPAGANGSQLGFIPVMRNMQAARHPLTVATAVNPDYFVNYYGARLPAEQGFVEVVRFDGTALLSTDEGHAGGRRDFLERLADVEFGTFEETLSDGTAMITAFRASRFYPLVVVMHIRRDYALQEWVRESRRLLWVAMPALLAIVVLTTLLFVHRRRIEEHQSEIRQRELDRLAATVFRTVDSGALIADASHRIVTINPAVTTITGYAEDDLIGRKWHVLAADTHPPQFLTAISAELAQTGSWHGEIWHRHKSGERYVAWFSVNQVRDEKGQAIYNVAAFSDITERKRAEEAQLHAIIDASPEAVLLVDSDGTIAFANAVSETVFGYTRAEMACLGIGSLVPLAQRHPHAEHMAAFNRDPLSRPMGSGMDLKALRKDGTEFPATISLSPIRIGDRRAVIAAVSDITQRILHEQALRVSEERWKFALEGTGEGVWDWSIVTGETLFSKRILDFWGCAENAARNRIDEWTGRIHDADRESVMADLQACLDGKRETCAVEHRARCEDGSWRWALVRGMVVGRDAGGEPQRMIGTYADITERKTVENELVAAKEAAEALLERVGMAERRIVDISEQTQERIGQELHDDLGQHLTGAAFLSEILFRKLDATASAEREDAANITRLINAAVAKTRTLAQGLYPVELKEVGLRSMMEQLARDVEATYEIECHVVADDRWDNPDPGTAINLFRMAQEAINNALRHGKATRIYIRTMRTAEMAILEIEDNGRGLDETVAVANKGGLGMHTMRYRASLIGASLHILTAAGGGTKVVIALPLPEESHAAPLQRET